MNNFKPKENKMINDSEKLRELRKLRDDYQAKADETQKEIDKEILKLNNVLEYAGKWVRVNNIDGNGTSWIGLVRNMHRLMDGIRLYYTVAMEVDGDDCVTLWTFNDQDGLHLNIEIGNVGDIEVIDKETAMKFISDKLEEFKEKIGNENSKTEEVLA